LTSPLLSPPSHEVVQATTSASLSSVREFRPVRTRTWA
jgi:hypothetical protein